MKYTKFLEMLFKTRDLKNCLYTCLKYNFLYNSNKIYGSEFSKEHLAILLDKNIVKGTHYLGDVFETINSFKVFDTIIDTLETKIINTFIKDLYFKLTFNHKLYNKNSIDLFNLQPNIKLYESYKLQEEIKELLDWYYNLNEISLKEIAIFHIRFQLINPFKDGRIGRFIMLKQLLENRLPLKIIPGNEKKSYKKILSSCNENNYNPLYLYIII